MESGYDFLRLSIERLTRACTYEVGDEAVILRYGSVSLISFFSGRSHGYILVEGEPDASNLII